MQEQRKFQRVPYAQAIEYRLSPGQEAKGCLSSDYSRGGLKLWAQDFIPLNTTVFLDFVGPTSVPMQVAGKVVWIQRVPHGETYQAGVQFEQPASDTTSPEMSSRFSF